MEQKRAEGTYTEWHKDKYRRFVANKKAAGTYDAFKRRRQDQRNVNYARVKANDPEKYAKVLARARAYNAKYRAAKKAKK